MRESTGCLTNTDLIMCSQFRYRTLLAWTTKNRNLIKYSTVNSLYCTHPRDRELVSFIARVRNNGYFSQKSVFDYCQGFSSGLYHQGDHNSKVSTRRELTVRGYVSFSRTHIHTCPALEYKNLETSRNLSYLFRCPSRTVSSTLHLGLQCGGGGGS